MSRVRVSVQLGNITRKIGRAKERTQPVLDNQVLQDMNDFLPADTWALRDSSLTNSNIGQGELKWKTPYANRLHKNPQFNFAKDKNPKAGGLWDERAKAVYRPDWVEVAQREMENNL
ncbi:minor capsid protein [Cytobacillus kochii]|uniref:minor capsid protein n=1 Tax=Cytobacillus kochii TaxID=859143 RepID=UPI002E1F1567|nr:minor capsid protein [Cytobacillus kochii]